MPTNSFTRNNVKSRQMNGYHSSCYKKYTTVKNEEVESALSKQKGIDEQSVLVESTLQPTAQPASAKEMKYHNSCQNKFHYEASRTTKKSTGREMFQIVMEVANSLKSPRKPLPTAHLMEDAMHETVEIGIQSIPSQEDETDQPLIDEEFEEPNTSSQRKRRRRTFAAINDELAPYPKKPSMSTTLLDFNDERRKKFQKHRCGSVGTLCASSQRLKEACNQEYMSVTYDLATAMPALKIQKIEGKKYAKLFIQLGPFHMLIFRPDSYLNGKWGAGLGVSYRLFEWDQLQPKQTNSSFVSCCFLKTPFQLLLEARTLNECRNSQATTIENQDRTGR
ncbi:hypothetical protein DAPPUDRAFT_118651 [Daphnia pulex]|uniref:Uncharacterized protein n=1 Tax=Daphnia pulex TaxID=6669 RepID=E9HWA6_DAPPU|nr:hypothetical protein DAPPUDRAFT_118651 [Daphnia pulex]|eukprot:EFX63975.1 hypothetical protein DAPPUDRAFT_118651 [Daphnia pulex]